MFLATDKVIAAIDSKKVEILQRYQHYNLSVLLYLNEVLDLFFPFIEI